VSLTVADNLPIPDSDNRDIIYDLVWERMNS